MGFGRVRAPGRTTVRLADLLFAEAERFGLRVTRPAFIEGMRALKKDPNYDPNTMATRQEMRAYVCGQCHVEYYFKGPEKRLVYPWANGLRADDILAYYEKEKFTDWTHADSPFCARPQTWIPGTTTPPSWPLSSALIMAGSETIGPRAVFTRKAPRFIMANSFSPIMPRVCAFELM